MHNTRRQSQLPVTPPPSTSSIIPSENSASEQKGRPNRRTFPIVDDEVFTQDLDEIGQQFDPEGGEQRRYLMRNELIGRFNRQIIPIMSDEIFLDNVDSISQSCDMESFELELRHYMDKESTRLKEAFNAAKLEMGMKCFDLFKDKSDQFLFMKSIRTLTVHGSQVFATMCLPMLIESSQKKDEEHTSHASCELQNINLPKEGGSRGLRRVSERTSKKESKRGPKTALEGVSKRPQIQRRSARINARPNLRT